MAGPRVEVTGSTPVDGDPRGLLQIAFTVLARRARDVAALEVAVEHDAGAAAGRIPAPPIRDGAGRGVATIDARALPAGRALVRITPLGPRDQRGEPGLLPVAVPLAGADPALRIATWEPVDRAIAHPGARAEATPRFALAWEGAGAAVVQVTMQGPRGVTLHGAAPAPAGGAGTLAPIRLGRDAPAGAYRVTARLVGEGGHVSEPAVATLRLGARGPGAPRVDRVRRRTRDGALIVRGAGLDGPDLAVLLDGAPAPVAAVADGELVVRAEGLVAPATLEVRTARGAARAPGPVRPRPSVAILPEEPVVIEGDAVRLHAVVEGTRDGAVRWSLEGRPDAVALDEDGTLRAGAGAPDAVTVRAASAADPDVAATATVRILAPVGAAGELAARGGTVTSPDGRATLVVPPGALAAPAAIEVRSRRARPARRGEIVAAEVALTPAELAGEAELVVALEAHAAPGSRMAVLAEADGRWEPAGEAVVDVHGMSALVTLTRIPARIRLLPEVTRVRDLLPAEPSVPTISNVEGSPPVEEGATVAVLVTGTNFVPGASYVTVRTGPGGPADTRIQAWSAAVTRDGTRLGTTIRVDPIPELPGGPPGSPPALSGHVLRVETPAGYAEAPFPILGRDEIRVRAGEVVTVSEPVRLSRLDVDPGGRLDVASTVPPVTIEVLADAQIWGDVRVVAAGGAPGGGPPDGSTPGPAGAGGAGAAPFNAGGGGAGGPGALLGTGGAAVSTGATGAAGLGAPPATLGTGGAGGLGSPGAGWGLHPHSTGDGAPGAAAPNPHVVSAGESSWPPRLAPGAGGGGGGGGGGEGLTLPGRPGGGGGGGGAGGGAVRIAAGRELWIYGSVVARGGDGGRGGLGSGDWWISAGHGGSGGGGGGGAIHVAGLQRGHGPLIATSGATPPARGSAVQVEARTPLQIALGGAPTGEIRADGWVIGACRPAPAPGPDLFHIPQLVATVPEWEVRGLDANMLAVRNGEDEDLFPVLREHVFPNAFSDRNSFFVRTVPLRPGFNHIRAQRWLEDPPFPIESNSLLMECADVRVRRVLHLPDTIAAYEFAVALQPEALTVPAERSATIGATVTASQATGLLWSVEGGPDHGTVAPASGGGRYTAPSRPPAGPVRVRAASSLDPARYALALVTVLAGIRITASPASGTPAVAALPSANAGQAIEVAIPPEVLAIGGTGFAGVQVEVPTLRPAAGGGCERAVLPVAAVVAPGMASLTATIPACAAPRGWVRVPGHGSAELQIVPTVTGFEGDRAAEPEVLVRGTGFACGETDVLVDGAPLPPGAVAALTCGSLRLAQWPPQGALLSVRTVGGEGARIPVP